MAAAGDWLLVGQSGVQTEQSRLALRRGNDEAGEGAPAGIVYAYLRGPDGRWSEAQRFQAPASASGDAFGAAIAMNGHACKRSAEGGVLKGSGA